MSFGFTRLLQNPLRIFWGFGTSASRQVHHITGFNPTPATQILPCTLQNSSSQLVEAGSSHMVAGGAWSYITTRFRKNIQNVKECKRLKKYSWITRISTEKGRIMIMKKMLRGRYIYSN